MRRERLLERVTGATDHENAAEVPAIEEVVEALAAFGAIDTHTGARRRRATAAHERRNREVEGGDLVAINCEVARVGVDRLRSPGGRVDQVDAGSVSDAAAPGEGEKPRGDEPPRRCLSKKSRTDGRLGWRIGGCRDLMHGRSLRIDVCVDDLASASEDVEVLSVGGGDGTIFSEPWARRRE